MNDGRQYSVDSPRICGRRAAFVLASVPSDEIIPPQCCEAGVSHAFVFIFPALGIYD